MGDVCSLTSLFCCCFLCLQVVNAKALSDEALMARYGPIEEDTLRSQLRKANLTMYS